MRGHIRKYKGRWAGVIELDRDPVTGKRRQKWVYADTEKECQQKVNELIYQIQTNTYVETSKFKVGDYLDMWLKNYAKANVAPSTYVSYESIIRLHIKPYIGNVNLSKLKPLQIQSMYNKLLDKGLSTTSVLYVYRVLHKAFNQAKKWNIMNTNVAEMTEPPRKKRLEYNTWDNDTIIKALELVKNTPLYLPILLAATTGMRQGEICGLQWQDIDLEKKFITVRHTYQRVAGRMLLKETKTDGSRRMVAIPDIIVDILKSQRTWQKENKMFFGPDYQITTFVNTWEDGRPVHTDYVSKAFKKFVNKHNLPPIRFHDLRHTHATELLKAGVNPKIVSERLGHSNIRITLDTYSHVLPTLQKEAAEIIANNIFGDNTDIKYKQKS